MEVFMGDSQGQTKLQQCQDSAQPKYVVSEKEFTIGTWYEFGLKEEHKTLAKLAWKSHATGRLVFTNENNAKVCTLTVPSFTMALRTGRARPAAEVLERSISFLKKSARKSFRVTKSKSFRLSD
jgi:hypothetical protein